jgi:hypothetical protein
MLPGECCHTPEGAVIREHGKMLDSWTDRKLMGPGDKNLLQCPFIYPESHTKWCKIQLQLYSQKTAPNYLTSGFNNIHLKCAQQNCMDCTDTALSTDTSTNTRYWKVWQLTYSGYQDLQHQWLIPDTFLERIMRSNVQRNCKNMSAGLQLLFCALAVSSNYNNYLLSSFDSNILG